MQAGACTQQEIAPAVSQDAFRKAMRNVAGTVAVVTSGAGSSRRGLTITAICSLSADPPSVAICINRKAEAHDVIQKYGVFGISILSAAQDELARKFSGQDGTKGIDRFSAGRWTVLETTAPLLEEAVANMDCKVIKEVCVGTHTLFCGLVVATHASPSARPLVHYDGGFVSLA